VVAGFNAVVDVVKELIPASAQVVQMGYRDQVAKLDEVAALHHAGKRCVVVFMGDIHFSGFQYLERVERACGHRVETMPGLSSAQVLASRARVCFDETTFITFHRRGDLEPFKRHLVHVLKTSAMPSSSLVPGMRRAPSCPPHRRYLLQQGVNPTTPPKSGKT
jgi:cobalt-precorrin-7 (C5)-methyltransferase